MTSSSVVQPGCQHCYSSMQSFRTSSGPGEGGRPSNSNHIPGHRNQLSYYDTIPTTGQTYSAKGPWVGKRRASKHQLQELLGHLNHAAAVVRPGKSFLRSIIEAPAFPANSPASILNAELTLWWSIFVSSWNRVSLLPPATPNITIISDASGSWGCGAFNQCTGEWFQISWPTTWKDINIAVKELLPSTIAAAIWGNQWKGQRILILSDNAAVVAALKARSARHVTLSHLIKCLFFWEATFDFEHNSEHIAGSLNTTADALSRNRLDLFFSLNPQAKAAATPIPNPVLAVLLDSKLQWTSPRWERLFRSCLNRV